MAFFFVFLVLLIDGLRADDGVHQVAMQSNMIRPSFSVKQQEFAESGMMNESCKMVMEQAVLVSCRNGYFSIQDFESFTRGQPPYITYTFNSTVKHMRTFWIFSTILDPQLNQLLTFEQNGRKFIWNRLGYLSDLLNTQHLTIKQFG